VPPLTATVADPSVPPLHNGSVILDVITNCGPWLIVALEVAVHPLASVTVAVYVPAVIFEILAVKSPVFHS